MKRWGRGPAGTEEKGNGEWVAEKRQRRREGTRARTKSPDAQTWWLNRGYAVQPLAAGADSVPTGARRKMSHRRGVTVSLCLIKTKSQNYIETVKCSESKQFCPSSILERLSFCWNGFCARDIFKLSKEPELPCHVSETLLTACRSALHWPTV